MRVSKLKVNATLQKQLFQMLFQLVADIKSPQEAEILLKDLLSDVELTTLSKRLSVAYWLSKNRSYTNIKDNLKVSSASVSDIAQAIKRPGWKLALAKVTADEWATQWEQKIKGLIGKK